MLGVNGAGKSTLVKALVGSLSLQAGSRVPAQKLRIGYFAQHQVDQLRSDQTPLQALMSHDPKLSETQARTFLGTFGFAGDRALQVTSTLSGGERARLALSLIVQARPNLLLLDEPTNHLDIVMRQALADALVAFEGALLVISHDRTMLRSVVDDLWLVAGGELKPFDDDLDGYARWLANQRQTVASEPDADAAQADDNAIVDPSGATGASTAPVAPDRRTQKRLDAERRTRLAPLSRAVTNHEKLLDKASNRLAMVREKLSDEGLYNDERKAELTDLLAEELAARQEVDNAEEKLLESMELLESASQAPEEKR